jgi:putative endonuclease
MYYVYFIRSQADGSVYVGMTENIEKRLETHNSGDVRSTKGKKPYRLVYLEGYINKRIARKREIRFKKSWQTKKEVLDRIAEQESEESNN